MNRKALKAARRADRDGSGPTLEEREPARFPGATGAFNLFGEVLMTGLLVAIASLGIITAPAGLAAGIRHFRRYLNAEASHTSLFWNDAKKAMPGGLAVGAITILIAAVLTSDILLANTGFLPGGILFAGIGWVGLVALGTALLAAAGNWSPGTAWTAAVRSIPNTLGADFVGWVYLAASVVFVGVATWMLMPVIIPALGIVTIAVVAIPARRRTR